MTLIRSIAHRLAGEQPSCRSRAASRRFDGATGWLNSEPLTPEGLARTRRPRRLLDLHLHQLAADAAVRPRLGREVRGRRPDGRRRPHAGVRVRARRRQHRRADARARRRVPGRDRQRLRRLARLRQPLLAGGLPRRRRGPDPLPPLRRGRVRDDRDGHPAAAARRRRRRTSTRIWCRSSRAGLEVAADWRTLQSPETYIGYGQSTRVRAARTSPRSTSPHGYAAPAGLPLNAWALAGTWTVARHAAVSNEPGARIAFQFHARDVNLVMGPATQGRLDPVPGVPRRPARRRRARDGRRRPTAAGIVDEQRTYQLIRQPGPIDDRRFEIEFLDAGVEAYCFTFG